MPTVLKEVKEETALCVIPEFNEFELELKKFTDNHECTVYDMTNKKQEKAARSDQRAIGVVCANLTRARDGIKDPMKAEYNKKIELLDGEYKRIDGGLRVAQASIKGQIKKHEDEIKLNEARIQEAIDNIICVGTWDAEAILNCDQLNARLTTLKAIAIDESFEGRKGDAAITKDETIQKIEGFIAIAKVKEIELAEAEIKRIALAEENKRLETLKIELTAKKKAEADAQKLINDAEAETKAAKKRAEDAEAKSLLDASEKERLALEETERLKLEAKLAKAKLVRDADQAKLNQAIAVKAEAERIESERLAKEKSEADALAAREKDKEHRKLFNNEALGGLVKFGLSEAVAKAAIRAVATGKIPHITINY